ncbi:MAG: Ig-like domain-containing protein [Thermoplasmatota archaeon]
MLTLCIPIIAPASHSSSPSLVSAFIDTIEIQPGKDYIINWSADRQKFNRYYPQEETVFSDEVKSVIAKTPRWLHQDLIKQFELLSDTSPYIDLLKKVSKKYTDEIAFCIAFAPKGNIPSPEVLFENVYWLYEIDTQISYADIVEYDEGDGNYFSTIQYQVLSNGSSKQYELPRNMYYWYIVHPQLLGESALLKYDSFWRDYLFNHNDIGYPLLKEKIQDIQFLWDEQSYFQSADRLWNRCISSHPTAVEAMSYWIGKTVPYQATGSRPAQPNIIAHEHNGWCGELQRLAIAAQRTGLIPTIGACNIGEDHVWREFYHNGWHQNDNWWADGGGSVDIFEVYAHNWGKDMSAVFTWRGDDTIKEVTSNYVPPEDLINVTVEVSNGVQPYDGALVTVFVKGPKDITWYKNKILNTVESFWERLPPVIQESRLKGWYQMFQDFVEEKPDVIDGGTATIWNYTDTTGSCKFRLGKYDEYVFLIQKSTEELPWPVSFHNNIRVLKTAEDRTFHVLLCSDYQRRPQMRVSKFSSAEMHCDVDIRSSFVQLQKNIRNNHVGQCEMDGDIDFFVVDSTNLKRYQQGKSFTCFYAQKNGSISGSFPVDQDCFLVLRNPMINTMASVVTSFEVYGDSTKNNIVILDPLSSTQNPSFSHVGNQITITGVSTEKGMVSIHNDSYEIPQGFWEITWNTSKCLPGLYHVVATCGNVTDELMIELVDVTPPLLHILYPANNELLNGDELTVSGFVADESSVKQVIISIDDEQIVIHNPNRNWSRMVSIEGFSSGVHTITVTAVDTADNSVEESKNFIIDPEVSSPPVIHQVYHQPSMVSNASNVIVYANVSFNSFPIKDVQICYSVDAESVQKNMFQYASFPVQGRHSEDPLRNQSNQPVFGIELGQFPKDTVISYYIVATDIALHAAVSEEYEIIIQ